MTNKEKLEKLIKTYEKDIDDNNFKRFVNEVLSNCGSIALKKIEDAFGTMISYYRDIYVIKCFYLIRRVLAVIIA